MYSYKNFSRVRQFNEFKRKSRNQFSCVNPHLFQLSVPNPKTTNTLYYGYKIIININFIKIDSISCLMDMKESFKKIK